MAPVVPAPPVEEKKEQQEEQVEEVQQRWPGSMGELAMSQNVYAAYKAADSLDKETWIGRTKDDSHVQGQVRSVLDTYRGMCIDHYSKCGGSALSRGCVCVWIENDETTRIPNKPSAPCVQIWLSLRSATRSTATQTTVSALSRMACCCPRLCLRRRGIFVHHVICMPYTIQTPATNSIGS